MGGIGWVVTNLGSGSNVATQVAMLPNGRIVVGGYSKQTQFDGRFALVRYLADGSLDNSIHGTGIVTARSIQTRIMKLTAWRCKVMGRWCWRGGKEPPLSTNDFVVMRFIGGFGPVVAASSASGVDLTTANVHGVVNPNGLATTAWIEWGEATSFGNRLPVSLLPNNSSGSVSVASMLTGLTPGTTYYWRVVAMNTDGIGSEFQRFIQNPGTGKLGFILRHRRQSHYRLCCAL